jgi:hypothetical protein
MWLIARNDNNNIKLFFFTLFTIARRSFPFWARLILSVPSNPTSYRCNTKTNLCRTIVYPTNPTPVVFWANSTPVVFWANPTPFVFWANPTPVVFCHLHLSSAYSSFSWCREGGRSTWHLHDRNSIYVFPALAVTGTTPAPHSIGMV